jgi:hypothetical protein
LKTQREGEKATEVVSQGGKEKGSLEDFCFYEVFQKGSSYWKS